MRFAICNETFEGWDHLRVCQTIAGLGYSGLELAPFTLAPCIGDVSTERRQLLRRQAEEHGLVLVGLHWLLARTQGLHLTSGDREVRRRTASYLVELARCCHELGGDILVLGSPDQRRIPEGATLAQATDYAIGTLREAMSGIADHGVHLCLEPLSLRETDFVNTCATGLELIQRVDHPMCRLHLDVKAMSSEDRPIPELIRQFGPTMGHFHANDPSGRGPGFGALDFTPIFDALKDIRYDGWVSVEVFDTTPDPLTIARESIRYMKECAQAVERAR
jgi:sugar phosphate isomerase/epimerase